ncbi:alpha/beta hydrolase [Streptomyces seoulensis]
MVNRPRTRRPRRAVQAALAAVLVALPVTGAARPADVPAPAPTVRAALGTVTPASLAARYAATRQDVEAAERMAAGHGDGRRAAALRALTDTGRHLLAFDGRHGGRSVEVFGDLARAERVAVLVPGADTTVDDSWRLRDAARALERELPPGSAVVAWLGYRTPATVSLAVLNDRRGSDAASALSGFVGELTRALPHARTSLVCHSYGTVVCAHAAARVDAADVVLCGSPGTGFPDAGSLHTRATVWAGRGGDDWIGDVPHVRWGLGFAEVGLGADPVSAAFGARVFDAGDGGHADYFEPGSVSLRNIARIVANGSPAGAAPQATAPSGAAPTGSVGASPAGAASAARHA